MLAPFFFSIGGCAVVVVVAVGSSILLRLKSDPRLLGVLPIFPPLRPSIFFPET